MPRAEITSYKPTCVYRFPFTRPIVPVAGQKRRCGKRKMRFWASRRPTVARCKGNKSRKCKNPCEAFLTSGFSSPSGCYPVDLSTARSPQNHLILGRLGSSEEASGINAKRRKVRKGFWAAGCSGARISCRTNISRESGAGETPPFQLGELENHPPGRMTLSGK